MHKIIATIITFVLASTVVACQPGGTELPDSESDESVESAEGAASETEEASGALLVTEESGQATSSPAGQRCNTVATCDQLAADCIGSHHDFSCSGYCERWACCAGSCR